LTANEKTSTIENFKSAAVERLQPTELVLTNSQFLDGSSAEKKLIELTFSDGLSPVSVGIVVGTDTNTWVVRQFSMADARKREIYISFNEI
jgi:hypothetical protein